MEEKAGRILTFEILRYNPQDPDNKPKMVNYQVEEAPGMSIYIALHIIREKFATDLQFDFVCRAGICGSCGMVVNGRPMLGCRTQTKIFDNPKITLMPMPVFELIGDLSVDTGKTMRELSEHLETWIHDKRQDEIDINRLEEKMEPKVADAIYELDRCIECGICLAACGTKRMRDEFIGAVGLMKVARFHLDPRDHREDDDFYDLIGDDKGVFGCMSLMGCEDFCPKELPHQEQIAFIRRKMVFAGREG